MIFPFLSSNLRFSILASILHAASCANFKQKSKQCSPRQACLDRSNRAALSPFAASAATAIKMYVTAVQIAEFLIMVVILMSLPKLVTS